MESLVANPETLYRSGTSPHSFWFGWLAETGVVGFVGILQLFGVVVFLLVRGRRRGDFCAASIVTSLLPGVLGFLVNGYHIDISSVRYLWVTAALGLASCTPIHENGRGER